MLQFDYRFIYENFKRTFVSKHLQKIIESNCYTKCDATEARNSLKNYYSNTPVYFKGMKLPLAVNTLYFQYCSAIPDFNHSVAYRQMLCLVIGIRLSHYNKLKSYVHCNIYEHFILNLQNRGTHNDNFFKSWYINLFSLKECRFSKKFSIQIIMQNNKIEECVSNLKLTNC